MIFWASSLFIGRRKMLTHFRSQISRVKTVTRSSRLLELRPSPLFAGKLRRWIARFALYAHVDCKLDHSPCTSLPFAFDMAQLVKHVRVMELLHHSERAVFNTCVLLASRARPNGVVEASWSKDGIDVRAYQTGLDDELVKACVRLLHITYIQDASVIVNRRRQEKPRRDWMSVPAQGVRSIQLLEAVSKRQTARILMDRVVASLPLLVEINREIAHLVAGDAALFISKDDPRSVERSAACASRMPR